MPSPADLGVLSAAGEDPLFIGTTTSAKRDFELALQLIGRWGVSLRETRSMPAPLPEGVLERVGLSGFGAMLRRLEASVPNFSRRYAAHMLPEVAVPAILAHFAATFLN